jgi:hypothetical protein
MGKILRISLILVTIVLSFYNLSFADQLAKGISSTNSPNELIYEKWILHREGIPPFSSPEKAGSGSNLYGANSSKAIRNREFSMNPEITNTMQSSATTEIQKKDLSHFENSQLSKGRSSYHFGKIQLTKNNLDPSLDFLSILSVAQYKEENPLSWTLEKLEENDIFKSIAILLEFKLNF